MMRWKPTMSAVAGGLFVLLIAGALPNGTAQGAEHTASGLGSCTLKNWNPNADPDDAKDLPEGSRPQTYKPDDYDCTGAKFASNGSEFAKFPQPHDFPARTQTATVQANPVKGARSSQTKSAQAAARSTRWRRTSRRSPTS